MDEQEDIVDMYVVMDATVCGKPVFVAVDEDEAADYLDGLEKEARDNGLTVERQNSITLTTRNRDGSSWRNYTTHRCPSSLVMSEPEEKEPALIG